MNRIKINIIFCLLIISLLNGYSQINCITDPPLPPAMTLVTVQPETGNTVINWSKSPSTGIAAYIIYSYNNGDALPLDTVWDASVTSYTLVTTATKYLSVYYVVAAMRLPRCTSILSNAISTIFSEVSIDTCENKLIIKWNKYSDYPEKVNEYKIMVSVNGEPFTEKFTTGNNTTVFSFSGFITNSQYCFYIKALLEDGSVSTSNRCCISTRMQRPPAWINADYATVTSENKISLSFTIDPASEIDLFHLEKRGYSETSYQQIAQFESANGKVLFTDNDADIRKISFYRLSAINNCNIPAAISNRSSNIVLKSELADDIIVLSWNQYKSWLGNVSSYRIFVDTGNGFEEKGSVQPEDTLFKINYKDLMYAVSGDKVCFKIEADENANPYVTNGHSVSSSECISPEEVITVPNIFTPDNDLLNDFFRPVLSFTPKDYHLVISDKRRNILFETDSFQKEWDGTNNGIPQQQGVYLWFLQVTTPTGKIISKTGTVTIFSDKK